MVVQIICSPNQIGIYSIKSSDFASNFADNFSCDFKTGTETLTAKSSSITQQ